MKKQSNVVKDYIQNVIKKSWTWHRLTEEEQKRFININVFDKIKGNDKTRIEWLNTIYESFLCALGYKPIGWREPEKMKMLDFKLEVDLMKIYIVERNNPTEWIEPEVYLDGKKAVQNVKKEYKEQMEELGTSQEKADAGFGSCGCYWIFNEDSCCGSCLIDRDIDGDCWEWRITEHLI